MSDSGVYAIYNKCAGKFYIGSSINLNKRLVEHKNSLNRGDHHSKYLQNSWNKYGEDNFIFKVIRRCSSKECLFIEQHFLNAINPEYNSCKIAGSCVGVKRSSDVKRAIALRQTGRSHSEESKKKMSDAKKGKPLSKAHAEKVRVSNLGKVVSEATKLKMSISQKGKTRSPETCLRISEIQRKSIYKLDLNTSEILGEYDSVSQAAQQNYTSISSISKAARGVTKSSGGYKWKFKNIIQCP